MIEHLYLFSNLAVGVLQEGGAEEAAQETARSGMQFAIGGYVAGLVLLLGYAGLLWVQARTLKRRAAAPSGG